MSQSDVPELHVPTAFDNDQGNLYDEFSEGIVMSDVRAKDGDRNVHEAEVSSKSLYLP